MSAGGGRLSLARPKGALTVWASVAGACHLDAGEADCLYSAASATGSLSTIRRSRALADDSVPAIRCRSLI
jgi:hypothetical protein